MAVIAGVDEAGRGPLAGPVAAAAVILPENHKIIGLSDSKKLSAKRRAILYDDIFDAAIDVGIGIVDVDEIDKTNILNATQKAMYKALGTLKTKPDKALIDGYALPKQIIPNEGIIAGDDKIDCIRAASIIAKVFRDRILMQYDIIFPEYGFASHKGYGTQFHLQQLQEFKATPIHRKSFKPVQENLPTITWLKSKRRIGQWGERLAALEYYKNDYKIIALNHHCAPYGEIDIIAENEDEIVFVEVKTAAGKTLGGVEDQVDEVKLQRLSNAIDKYIMDNEIYKDIRLDVYAVRLGKKGPVMKHFMGIELE
ncbi:MAG TPA: ribonuclease HII [Candidatus Marinimicrobia bacterium]|jgi:ribonuclease HII|nr:ribonuclease HII [Candidatus Neomarinimicrobiota bacterium]HJM69917.1 ribonuclease HII [Candidatus Neomarinimicrobiota bacterium]|tara:strand:+ start:6639 stop:7571 length:933 start_codon:yes stop_codon:yes gene_type:complete